MKVKFESPAFLLLILATSFVHCLFSQSGGENCASATVIPSLPFVGLGSTSGANDDYFENCPDVANAGGAPDHVYRYTNGNSIQIVDVSLCEAITDYDSQLFVYESICGASPIACQEDGCQSPAYNNAYNSTITNITLQPNTDYYFVIDGYNTGSSGNYQINIDLFDGAVPDSSEIPLVFIQTNGQSIGDEPKISASMHIINNGPGLMNYATDPYNEYDGTIGIEIRGSSSSMFPKKGYGLETRTVLDSNLNVSLFGMPQENDWILHGPYSDKSLIRNELAFYMASHLIGYAPRTQFCELIINDEYRGVYLFMEKIKRDPGRVDIARLTPQEQFGDDLTGGYIVKIDKLTGSNNDYWVSPYSSNSWNPQPIQFLYHYPKPDSITQVQKDYIETYVTSFENALNSPDYQHIFLGYRNLADINSFVDYFIMNEASRNVDGYRISSYMFKDKESKYGKLRVGPAWDYNLGFGNADYCQGGEFNDWAYEFNDNCPWDNSQVPFWWERLITDPEYTNRLRCRWDQLREGPFHTDSILNHIDSMTNLLGDAVERNFNKWDVLDTYVWPNNYVGSTYLEEIQFLKSWIQNRLVWLDQNMPGMGSNCSFLNTPEITLPELRLFPNPFDEYFFFEFVSIENTRISVTDVNGREIWRDSYAQSGLISINSQSIPELQLLNSGIYFVSLNTGGQEVTHKIVKR